MKPPGHRAWQCWSIALGIMFTAQAGNVALENYVLSGGGGSGQSGRFQVTGTIGQPVAESAASSVADQGIRAGFWSQIVRWLNVAPVAREDVIERRAGQAAHVLIETLLGNDADADFDPLQFVGVDATSASGGSLFQDGPWIIYEPSPANPTVGEDTFGYTIRDASGGMTTGLVRVRVAGVPGGGAPNALQVEMVGGPAPSVRVHFRGLPGRTYEIQTAADPAGPWTSPASLPAGADGTILYTEPASPGPRFYRIVEPNAP